MSDIDEATRIDSVLTLRPARLLKRPTYKQMVVTYVTLVGDDGIPDFKATDEKRRRECFNAGRCGICGDRLDYWKFAIGGPAVREHRFITDPAMHEDCARYSLKVCPYLNGSHRRYSEAPVRHVPKGYDIITHPGSINTGDSAPQVFLMKTRGYAVYFDGPTFGAVCRPWVAVEDADHGR